MSIRWILAAAIASGLVLAGCGSQQSSSGPAPLDSAFNVSVAAVADDLIETGSVRTGPGDQVEVFVDVEFSTGTLPLTYTVAFCPFATGTANCTQLGTLQDQGGGILSGTLRFPSTGVFAGVFTFTREGTVQFMTGLYKPGRGDFFFDVGLQPVSAVSGGLGPGFTPGSDPLSRGSVKIAFSGVSGTFEQNVELRGATPNTTYSVQFCAFPQGSAGCTLMTSVDTDAQGNGNATTVLPQGNYFGVFVFTRDVGGQQLSEFVTAFRVN